MAIVDSVAAFTDRASRFGISDADIALLNRKKAASFGAFAWIAVFNPNATDDSSLKGALSDILEREPSALDMSRFRRLHFESHAIAISDAKLRIERTDDSPIRKLPATEKAARHQAQVTRLGAGMIWSLQVEPSHALLDKVQQQIEENVPSYVELSACTSRQQELAGIKKDPSAKIVEVVSGALKVGERDTPDRTDLSGDFQLRAAFRRRALAYDQANLCDYETLEFWTEKLFAAMAMQCPPNYLPPGRNQILLADRHIFTRICEECRAGVLPGAAQAGVPVRPIQASILRLMNEVDVTFYLLPLPQFGSKSSNSGHGQPAGIDKEMEWPAKKGKGNLKKKGKGPYSKTADGKTTDGKGSAKGAKGEKKQLPAELKGCWTHVKGKVACTWFNMGNCRSNKSPGANCGQGMHLCMTPGCGEKHAAISCPKRAIDKTRIE